MKRGTFVDIDVKYRHCRHDCAWPRPSSGLLTCNSKINFFSRVTILPFVYQILGIWLKALASVGPGVG